MSPCTRQLPPWSPRRLKVCSAWPRVFEVCRGISRRVDDIGGELFFQKHSERSKISGGEELPAELHPHNPPLLVANSSKALIGLAQPSTVEIHWWNAVAPELDYPDRLIFDLDPDPALPWKAMLEAASLVRVVLDELGLTSFAKTSGGKGFHIVVPLSRRQGWNEVTAFSQAVARHMAQVVPDRFSAASGPRNRIGQISSITCATAAAQVLSRRFRCVPARAWPCRWRCHGMS